MAAPRRLVAAALVIGSVLAMALVWTTFTRGPSGSRAPEAPAAPIGATSPMTMTTTAGSVQAPLSAPSASPVPFARSLPEAEARQLKILDEIFASRNDNDPRLDKDLKVLSEAAKAAMRDKYRSLPLEKHNERGTLVFLLGRNLSTPQDFTFLGEVLNEPPCLGITDCSRSNETAGDSKDHQGEGGSVAIVLAYPQLNALKAIQKSWPVAPELRDAAQSAIAAGRTSRVAVVSALAEQIGR